MISQEGKNIWFLNDCPEYEDGWYFSDETSSLVGPLKMKEEAEKNLAAYSYELTNGDDK